jgi:hypothetical protein
VFTFVGFCDVCGQPLKAGSEKCSLCGTPGGRPDPVPMKAITDLPDFVEPAVVAVLTPRPPVAGRRWVILTIGAVGLIVVLVVAAHMGGVF